MIQLTDTQLQVALRALNDVIAPALQESASHVIEQTHLVIATLEFAKQRLPYTRRFYRQELLYFIDYASEVAALIATEDASLAEEIRNQCRSGQEELQRPEADAEDFVIVMRRLRELISSAVDRATGASVEAELSRLVVDRLKRFLPHQRTWLLPFGLDPAPDGLPSVDQLVELHQS
jgi:hypothetical protein